MIRSHPHFNRVCAFLFLVAVIGQMIVGHV